MRPATSHKLILKLNVWAPVNTYLFYICARKGQIVPSNSCYCNKHVKPPEKCVVCSECTQAADLSRLWSESLNQEAVIILGAPSRFLLQPSRVCSTHCSIWWCWRDPVCCHWPLQMLTQLAVMLGPLVILSGSTTLTKHFSEQIPNLSCK